MEYKTEFYEILELAVTDDTAFDSVVTDRTHRGS